MKNIAVIFAGGAGQRMGSEIPKQFLKVYGKDILVHTLDLFEDNNDIDEIYIACIEDWIPYVEELLTKHGINKVRRVFPGGVTGQDSIFIGLSEVRKDHEEAVVLLHDGVRPLVSQETISNCVASVLEYGSAVTVTPCFETPVHSTDGNSVADMPLRAEMYTAQAPQGFYLTQILEAHYKEREINPEYIGIVDSCGLMYKNGISSHLVMGNRGNIKVTTPDDYCTLLGNLNARDYEQLLALNGGLSHSSNNQPVAKKLTYDGGNK